MTPAEKRMDELLVRWEASLQRHERYLKLDDAAYARVEAWPKHQRPTRWVIELALKRVEELRGLLAKPGGTGREGLAEALELMSFLTSLLGSEHIDRFIPLATGKPPDTGVSGTAEQARLRRSSTRGRGSTSASGRHAVGSAPKAAGSGATAATRPATGTTGSSARQGAQTAKRPASSAASAVRPPSSAARPAAAPASSPKDATSAQVIADAVRMLEWGREWPAIAGLIARMADRPPEPDVWKILRAHRSEILARARRLTD
jgi:hypothetical protein